MDDVTAYFQNLLNEIQNINWVLHQELSFRQIDDLEAYIKGQLYLQGGFVLHIAEYVIIQQNGLKKDKYRYQLQNHESDFIARWDNAPHHNEIETFPDHKHCKDGTIQSSNINGIIDILDGLDSILDNGL